MRFAVYIRRADAIPFGQRTREFRMARAQESQPAVVNKQFSAVIDQRAHRAADRELAITQGLFFLRLIRGEDLDGIACFSYAAFHGGPSRVGHGLRTVRFSMRFE